MIISLDLAQKAGIAWYYNNTFFTQEVSGHVYHDQFSFIRKLIRNHEEPIVLIEDFVYFSKKNSIATQKSLIKRIGLIEFFLENEFKIKPELLNLNSVRTPFFKGGDKKKKCVKFFKTYVNKELTDNHSDALLMLFYKLNLPLDINTVSNYDIRITTL